MAWPKGKPRKPRAEVALEEPAPTDAFRLKRAGLSLMLQQAWCHHSGLEWRPVPIVPADAPDWEDKDAPPSPPV